MAKQYISVERTLTARPRSKRRRETGEGGTGGNITVVQNGSGGGGSTLSGDGHTHDNKSALDKLGVDANGYVTITDWQENDEGNLESITSKGKAGYADKAKEADKAAEAIHAENADKAKVAQNLAEDSTDWQTIDKKIADQAKKDENKFLRKDQDDETPHNLGVGKNLTVGGDTTTANLSVTGDATIKGKAKTKDLEADDATVNNNLTVSKDATIEGKTKTKELETDDATVNKNLTVGKDATVRGTTKTKDLEADDADIENHLSVGKNAGIGGNASIVGKTTTGELDTGDAVFRNRASSLDFISGFVAGKGWGITKEDVENALGVVETKYHLEIDKLTVRGQMRVYEMIISQLLGENDNRVFTAMMEVDHYDAATGRVYFDNKGGRLYNPFRKDDYIRVQQYNPAGGDGYIIKSYELLIAEIYSGYEKGERVDWVTIKNLSPSGLVPSEIISAGDTFTRWDNKTDAERKGLISITTVGPQTPYIDIMHGAKTDPDNALKGRIGNLSGIRHHLFGWLEGFGELLMNLYAVGDFRLRNTGENLEAQIEALRGLLSTNYAQTVLDITDENNYLQNATFSEMADDGQFRHWKAGADGVTFYTLAGLPLYENTSLMGNVAKVARLVEVDGKKVLQIVNNTLTQENGVIRKPGTHKVYREPTTEATADYSTAKDTLYLSVKMKVMKSGRLTLGFPAAENVAGSLPKIALDVEKATDWQVMEWEGTWDGKGDFVIGFTGEAYFSLLSLTDEPLAEFKKEYSTQIIQTAKNITLTANRVTANETAIAQLKITADGITADVTRLRKDMEGNDEELSSRISQAASDITAAVKRISANEKAISSLQITAEGIQSDVKSLKTDTEGLDKKIDEDIAAINRSLGTLDGKVKTLGDNLDAESKENDDRAAALATWQQQTSDRITAIAGKWDKDGNLIGYSTTTQTSQAISNAVVGLAKSSDVVAMESKFNMTADRLSMEVLETSEGYCQLLDDADFVPYHIDAWTKANGSVNTSNMYANHYSYYGYSGINELDLLEQTIWQPSDGVIKKIARNRWYTLSFYAKGSGTLKTFFYPGCADRGGKCYIDGVESVCTVDGYAVWNLTSNWARHTYTFKTLDESTFYNNNRTYYESQRILFRLAQYSDAYITMPRLELGMEAHGYDENMMGLSRAGIDITKGKIVLDAETAEATGNFIVRKLLTDGGETGIHVEIFDGVVNIIGPSGIANWRFGVDANGEAVLSYYDNTGMKLYDLGPTGLTSINNTSEAFVAVRTELLIKSIGSTDDVEAAIKSVLSSSSLLAKLFTRSSSANTYYRYRAKKTTTDGSTVYHEGTYADTASEAQMADQKLFTAQGKVNTTSKVNGATRLFDSGGNSPNTRLQSCPDGSYEAYSGSYATKVVWGGSMPVYCANLRIIQNGVVKKSVNVWSNYIY